MKARRLLRVTAVAMIGMATCLIAPNLRADGSRKALAKPQPEYPELARKLRLSGAVKIEVVIAPNGQVKETKTLGGHPVLADAAVRALKGWKFEAASGETTEILEFKFDMQ